MTNPPTSPALFALLVRGSQPVIFNLSDYLGFEADLKALAVSIFEDGQEEDRNMMILQALFASEADANACAAQLDLRSLAHSISQLKDEDWTAKSQAGLPPVEAGRFFIYGSHDVDKIPKNTPFPIRIDAGLAFGTGHHGTTKGCLLAFEDLLAEAEPEGIKPEQSANWPASILDLGCGSGVLAIAAAKSLNRNVTASDIDMDAVEVTIENARINGVAEWVNALQADGIPSNLSKGQSSLGKYDLIFANILAGPLMVLAADIKGALEGGGHVILAGLLDEQSDKVLTCYQEQGLKLVRRASLSGWTILTMCA